MNPKRRSVENWAKQRPRSDSAVVAYRAAARVLPYFLRWTLQKEAKPRHDVALIAVLRALLSAAVAAQSSSSDQSQKLRAAAKSAALSITLAKVHQKAQDEYLKLYVNPFDDNPAVQEVHQASTAIETVRAAAHVNVGKATECAADIIRDELWSFVETDCELLASGTDLNNSALWTSPNPTEEIAKTTRVALENREEMWGFWANWYRDVVDGRPQNWALLESVSLLPDEIWIKPKSLARKIAKLSA